MYDFLAIFLKPLIDLGPQGLCMALILILSILLLRALQQERQRSAVLVDRIMEQSRETAIMIERIAGK